MLGRLSHRSADDQGRSGVRIAAGSSSGCVFEIGMAEHDFKISTCTLSMQVLVSLSATSLAVVLSVCQSVCLHVCVCVRARVRACVWVCIWVRVVPQAKTDSQNRGRTGGELEQMSRRDGEQERLPGTIRRAIRRDRDPTCLPTNAGEFRHDMQGQQAATSSPIMCQSPTMLSRR